MLGDVVLFYLSLDDVEQEVRAAAAAQQVSQAQRLVETLHLLLDEGRGSARGAPEGRAKYGTIRLYVSPLPLHCSMFLYSSYI